MKIFRKKAIGFLTILILFSLLLSCASKSAITQNVARSLAVQGEWEKAAAVFLKNKKATNALDILLNRGLSHFEMGNFNEAEENLRRAFEVIDEQFTKSVSRTAAALMTNDRTLPYDGTNFEKGILHYYRALNFYRNGNLEGFSIEARALTNYLVQLPSLTKKKYNDDAFLRYIGGLGFDLANQHNDAWIAYKHSVQLYSKTLGQTPQFIRNLERIAAYKTGVIPKDSLEKFGITPPVGNVGRIVIFIEAGVIAGLQSEHITIPILEEDTRYNFYASDFDYERYGLALWDRYQDPYYGTRYRVKDWIHIAIPQIVNDGKSPTSTVVIQTNSFTDYAELAHHSSKVFQDEFQERFPSILARAVIRMILKRTAYTQAEKEGGQVAGIFTRVLGEALETADTRSCVLLPDKFFVFDSFLPVGKYSFTIVAKSEQGNVVDIVDFKEINLAKNEIKILRTRIK